MIDPRFPGVLAAMKKFLFTDKGDLFLEGGDLHVIICGDRNYDKAALIGQVIDVLQPKLVIEGEARGADTLSRKEAEKRGIAVMRVPANWAIGKAAGPIRNKAMLKALLVHEGAKMVVAFHDDIKKSKGTKGMLKLAKDAGILTLIVTENPTGFARIEEWQ